MFPLLVLLASMLVRVFAGNRHIEDELLAYFSDCHA